MNQDERNQCARLLTNLAVYYSRQMTRGVLEMMVDDLEGLTLDQIEQGMRLYRRDPKNRTFPLPASIRAICEPSHDPDSEAREVAARITGAVTKFGHPNGIEARAYIGEDGWGVVQTYGGWSWICENLGVHLEVTSFQAQLREVVKNRIRMKPNVENRLAIASSEKRRIAYRNERERE